MLGVWYMSLFLGSYLAGSAGRWWSISAKPVYFAAMAAVACLAAIALFIVSRTLARKLDAPLDLLALHAS
jgi:poly(3-hydroxybutyrate) depolymerase